MRFLLLSLMLFGLCSASEVGPSPAETLCLEYINRLRADPVAESERILVGVEGGISGIYAKVDFEKCREEIKQLRTAPPLVFDLQLLQSARAHAQYMIEHNITSHDEIPGKKGFTGARPFQRVRAAGYLGMPMGENAFLRAVSAWNSHCGFIIDWGPSPDGMQAGRGHRMSCVSPYSREIGIAAIRHDKERFQSTCHNFGNNPKVARYLGGVFYIDNNKNNFYDIGEGVADVQISADSGESCTTWPSGAYTLALNHQDTVNITVTYKDVSSTWTFAAGKHNIRCAGPVPNNEDITFINGLLNGAHTEIDAYWLSRGRFKTQTQVEALGTFCREEQVQLQETQFALLRVFTSGSESAFKKAYSKHQKHYAKTKANVWFSEIKKAMPVYADVKNLVDKIRKRKALRLGELEKHMSKLKRCMKKIKQADIHQILQEQYYLLSRTVAQR